MKLSVPVTQPFSFGQTVTFIRRFPPCRGDYVITDDSLTAAVAIDGRAVAFTIRAAGTQVHVELEEPRHAAAIVARASHFIGATDDLTSFYAAAEGDPPFRRLVQRLYGLHHVRFLTLEEIAVYCVMMQRTPVALASRLKRKFLDRFGIPIAVGDTTLQAMPEMDFLAALDADDIAKAIGHARKGPQIATVVRAVAAIGEPFLRSAPYGEARDALLEIPGIGPFSAAAILLRGLGRMDELPELRGLADEARELYGDTYDAAALARRYGDQIGYWSFYLKTGVARLREATAGSKKPRTIRAQSGGRTARSGS